MSTRNLRQYFQPAVVQIRTTDDLKRPISSSVLEAVNAEILANTKPGKYNKWKEKERADIGKYARIYGSPAAVKHFKKKFPQLTRQTARSFAKYYSKLLDQKQSGEHSLTETPVISEMPPAKRGRKTLLPSGAIDDVINIIMALRAKGAVVSGNVINGVVRGVLKSSYPWAHLTYSVTYETSRQIVYHIETRKNVKLVSRKCTTAKLPIPVGVYNEVKLRFQMEINKIVKKYHIPPQLIVNHDQTPITYVNQSNTTLANKGSKQVPIAQSTNRKQITGNLGISTDATVLPFQLIYQGKTKACLPKTKFPDGFHVTQTENHWSNEKTCGDYVEVVLDPYFTNKREELGLPADQKCLVLSDVFKAQQTESVIEKYESRNMLVVKVII